MIRRRIILSSLTILSVIIVLLVSLSLIGLDSSSQNRTEIQPILDRFPRLEKVSKAYWSAEVIGDSNLGPSSYWMKGFVYLEPGVAEKFKDSYAWHDVTLNPSIQLDTDEGKEHSWAFSEEFNEYVKSSDYVGKFYFDVRNELIYFEVEK